MTATLIDQGKLDAFMSKALTDLSGTTATVLAFLGDRLGLFRALDAAPATSEQLAARAGVYERYAREWLRGMRAAGYLELDPDGARYALPPEHAQVLADEGGPFFLGGVHQELMGMLRPLDALAEAFRSGGGVPQSVYPADAWDGMRRFSQGWFENLLLQEWIPAAARARSIWPANASYPTNCERGNDCASLITASPEPQPTSA